MSEGTKYNPAKHHRRSIRLKGHDYAGGGVYFVTLCAHRSAGDIFAANDVREMVAREWESVGASLVGAAEMGRHETGPYVVMPDHFHGLIRIPRGGTSLGDVIGAFKSRVVHEYIAGVKADVWPRFDGKIWHRNYYEMIVRSAEAEEKIAEYIRMNPWRCVQAFGNGLRGIGNPALWNGKKLGVLCSRNAPRIGRIPDADVYFGGWHSPKEKEIFEWLLGKKRRVVACPAWDIERAGAVPGCADALKENRILILEMRNRDGDLAAAEQRNRFVIENADGLFVPHTTSGGMLERLLKEKRTG